MSMDHAAAGRLVEALSKAAEDAARSLKDVTGGDPAREDERQVECFDLAWAIGDIRACRSALAATAGLDRDLAFLFLRRRARRALDRLGDIAHATGQDPAPLHAIRDGADWAALADWATPERRRAIGRAVIAADGDVGSPVLPEDAAMARDSFARFAKDTVAPLAEAIHREDLTVPETILAPMRELGAFGLAIPEQYGGTADGDGEDATTMVAVTEALSQASLAAAGSLITRPEILSRALLAGGTEAQKSHWLPRIASGETLCAIAITEPDYGSDVAGLQLRATRADGGWRLNGNKTWCTFAGKAQLLMVVARTDTDRTAGHRGLSLLLVEKPSDDGHVFRHEAGGGTLSGKAIPTIGYRGMHSFDVAFDNWFVRDDCVIGEEEGLGRGFYLTMAGMMGGRMQTAARACGVMRAALKAAIAYTQDRKVFGKPLAAYPLTLAKLADMAASLAACRALAYDVAGDGDAPQRAMDASLAKLVACRAAEGVTREALQLHGGMGYAEETAASRYFTDARVLSIFEGAEETLALKIIARGAMAAV